MTSKITSFLGGAAAVALIAGSVSAQEATPQQPIQIQTETGGAGMMQGRVIVEQGEPQVAVRIDDPNVTVDQATPEVIVDQPQPEIVVQQSPPRVSVEQQAPIVTVEQDQPVVTVRIPEPVVTVRIPRPEVNVDSAEPQVAVETPQPVVRFIRPEPRVVVEEGEPQVRVEQAEAQIQIDRAEQAEVRIDQQEPRVAVQDGGEAQVTVEEARAQVRVNQAEGADVTVDQAEAVVNVETFADAQGTIPQENRAAYMARMEQSPFYDMAAGDLRGVIVMTPQGREAGRIEAIGTRGDSVVAIVSPGPASGGTSGGPLVVPLELMQVLNNQVTMSPNMQAADLPTFDAAEVRIAPEGRTVADLLGS